MQVFNFSKRLGTCKDPYKSRIIEIRYNKAIYYNFSFLKTFEAFRSNKCIYLVCSQLTNAIHGLLKM